MSHLYKYISILSANLSTWDCPVQSALTSSRSDCNWNSLFDNLNESLTTLSNTSYSLNAHTFLLCSIVHLTGTSQLPFNGLNVSGFFLNSNHIECIRVSGPLSSKKWRFDSLCCCLIRSTVSKDPLEKRIAPSLLRKMPVAKRY